MKAVASGGIPKGAVNAKNMSKELNICLVTVTYGQRLAYVLQALESAASEGVHHAIVIDNGSVGPVEGELRERFGDWVTVERFDHNKGSAPAFKRGIQLACESGCELILLLDDDNVLTPRCLTMLIKARAEIACSVSDENCMVLAYRSGHQPSENIGESNGFLGFHVKDVPKKIFRRLCGYKQAVQVPGGRVARALPYAPYSGLLFHRELVHRHGVPDEKLVLYADDTEFTHRVVSSGGVIQLIQHAVIQQQEISWYQERGGDGLVAALVGSANDTAIFYSVRNRCYFEAHKRIHNRRMRNFNRFTFEAIIRIVCWHCEKKERWDLLRKAISDGESAKLGVVEFGRVKLIG